MTKILVTAREAADMLSVNVTEVYSLAASGALEKRYVGKGTREFRIPVESVEAYVAGLPTEPVEASS
ncbi:MAG: helix-turn-helix domain-containing protein [Nocardioidaceae bacterium]